MIKIQEMTRKVVPSQCAACGFYLTNDAEEYCNDCGHNKYYQINCPFCDVINVRIGSLCAFPVVCTGCKRSVPNPIEYMEDHKLRIVYHIKEEFKNEKVTIH